MTAVTNPPVIDPTRTQGTVELVRVAAEARGRHRFSCSYAAWNLLGELGRVFGWSPVGTTYVRQADHTGTTAARRNYEPGDSRDHKTVEGEDAENWATALVRAKRSPHYATLIADRVTPAMLDSRPAVKPQCSTPAPFDAIMDEFIEYAHGGEFSFAMAPGTTAA